METTCTLSAELVREMADVFDAVLLPYLSGGFVLGSVVTLLIVWLWSLRQENNIFRSGSSY